MPEVSDKDRLADIEAKLDKLLGKIESFEAAVGPMLANPGQLFAKMMRGGK